MRNETNITRVLQEIRQHPAGIDDDELSEITGVTPRQQVYQICRRLEAEGSIVRRSISRDGRRKKIHNFPKDRRRAERRVKTPDTTDHLLHIVEDAMGPDHDVDEYPEWLRILWLLAGMTDRSQDHLLDEAVRDLARKILKEKIGTEEEENV